MCAGVCRWVVGDEAQNLQMNIIFYVWKGRVWSRKSSEVGHDEFCKSIVINIYSQWVVKLKDNVEIISAARF